jgi:hypothetical protein
MKILSDSGRNKHGQKLVRAQCSCGATFIAREDNIKSGRTKSCGNCDKKPARKTALIPTAETESTFERGSVAWFDEQIKSKEVAAQAVEVRVKKLQADLAAVEDTDLTLLKKWTAESTAFEKLNHQIARLKTARDKAETSLHKDERTQAEVTREKIRAMRGGQ